MACFHKNSDYQYFLKILAEQAAKRQCCLHAWCLMTNHAENGDRPRFPRYFLKMTQPSLDQYPRVEFQVLK
jgi:hypothetical protein